MTSRSIFANQSSTWLSHEEYVGEVEPDAGMLLQELPHQRGLVSREIVEDDVDLLIGRAQGHDFQSQWRPRACLRRPKYLPIDSYLPLRRGRELYL